MTASDSKTENCPKSAGAIGLMKVRNGCEYRKVYFSPS